MQALINSAAAPSFPSPLTPIQQDIGSKSSQDGRNRKYPLEREPCALVSDHQLTPWGSTSRRKGTGYPRGQAEGTVPRSRQNPQLPSSAQVSARGPNTQLCPLGLSCPICTIMRLLTLSANMFCDSGIYSRADKLQLAHQIRPTAISA